MGANIHAKTFEWPLLKRSSRSRSTVRVIKYVNATTSETYVLAVWRRLSLVFVSYFCLQSGNSFASADAVLRIVESVLDLEIIECSCCRCIPTRFSLCLYKHACRLSELSAPVDWHVLNATSAGWCVCSAIMLNELYYRLLLLLAAC